MSKTFHSTHAQTICFLHARTSHTCQASSVTTPSPARTVAMSQEVGPSVQQDPTDISYCTAGPSKQMSNETASRALEHVIAAIVHSHGYGGIESSALSYIRESVESGRNLQGAHDLF